MTSVAPTHTRTRVVLVVFRALMLRVALQAQPKIIENGNYLYDSFNPAARDFVFNAVSKGYLQYAPCCVGCHGRLLRQTLTLPANTGMASRRTGWTRMSRSVPFQTRVGSTTTTLDKTRKSAWPTRESTSAWRLKASRRLATHSATLSCSRAVPGQALQAWAQPCGVATFKACSR